MKTNQRKILIASTGLIIIIASIVAGFIIQKNWKIDYTKVVKKENLELRLEAVSNTDEALEEIINKVEKEVEKDNKIKKQKIINQGMYFLVTRYDEFMKPNKNIAENNEAMEKALYYSYYIVKCISPNEMTLQTDASNDKLSKETDCLLAYNIFMYLKFTYRQKEGAETYLQKSEDIIYNLKNLY